MCNLCNDPNTEYYFRRFMTKSEANFMLRTSKCRVMAQRCAKFFLDQKEKK